MPANFGKEQQLQRKKNLRRLRSASFRSEENLITAAMIALMGGDKTERTEQSVFDPSAAQRLTPHQGRRSSGSCTCKESPRLY